MSTSDPVDTSKPASLDSLPPEIRLKIFKHVPQKYLWRLGQASFQMARALKALPCLSTTQVIDLLYQGDVKPLLNPYLTNNLEFAQHLTGLLRSDPFQTQLQKSQNVVETCQRLLLSNTVYGLGLYCLDKLHKECSDFLKEYIDHQNTKRKHQHRDIKTIFVCSEASVHVLEFLTFGWSPLQRFLLCFQGNNLDTILTMLSRVYENTVLSAKVEAHIAIRSAMLKHKEGTMKLICKLSEGEFDASERRKWITKARVSQSIQFVLLDALLSDRIPLKNHLVQIIFWMCVSGSSLAVKKLLSHPDVDPSIFSNLPLYICLQEGDRESVLFMSQDGRVDPSSWKNEALMYAIKNDDMDLTTTLLNDSRVSVTFQKHEAAKWAARLGHLTIFEMLLRKYGDSCLQKNDLLILAVKSNQTNIVRFLLKDPRVNPAVRKNAALKQAALIENAEIASLLLNHDKVNPAVDDNAVLKEHLRHLQKNWTSCKDKTEFIETFVYHPKVEQTLEESRIFQFAMDLKFYALNLFIKHPRVVLRKEYLLQAIKMCNYGLVTLLVESGRIDPGMDDNEAFILAVQIRSEMIVKFLMNDPRVDPSARNNAALRFVFHRVYKTTDLKKIPRISYPDNRVSLLYDSTSLANGASPYDCAKAGLLLIKHTKVQQRLAEEYPALSDPSVYRDLFLR